ncbi:MAG TPA: hypothetical protein VF162_10735 [Streptosporangiaceae bacterium]
MARGYFSGRFGACLLAGSAAIMLAIPAQASVAAHAKPDVSTPGRVHGIPAKGTPHFPAKTARIEQVRQLAECGGIMYAVGSFSTVLQNGRTYIRHNAFSFRATPPYAITRWNPNVNGTVNTIGFNSGSCSVAYLGGKFSTIRGVQAHNIAKVSTSAGTVQKSFAHSANGQVETIASYQRHLLVGGYFTRISGSGADPYMASLSPTSGRNDGFLHLNISGHYVYPGAAPNVTRIYNQQVSHSGKLDLVEGVFTSAGGRHRKQIFMLNLASRPRATVTGWTSPQFDGSKGYPSRGGYYYYCTGKEPFYLRSAAWSPDDSTIYIATTGYRPWNYKAGYPLRGLCDAAAAFPATHKSVLYKWRNFTGCYSLYSAAADAKTAYFAGHQLWSQSPRGCKKFRLDPKRVSAAGFEGLSPANGNIVFDPTRSRGLGADDMLVTRAGLWIASDNFDGSQNCGRTSRTNSWPPPPPGGRRPPGSPVGMHAGICLLPY